MHAVLAVSEQMVPATGAGGQAGQRGRVKDMQGAAKHRLKFPENDDLLLRRAARAEYGEVAPDTREEGVRRVAQDLKPLSRCDSAPASYRVLLDGGRVPEGVRLQGVRPVHEEVPRLRLRPL